MNEWTKKLKWKEKQWQSRTNIMAELIDFMNESMNKWMNEWMNKWMNEWKKKLNWFSDEWMKENEWKNLWKYEWK